MSISFTILENLLVNLLQRFGFKNLQPALQKVKQQMPQHLARQLLKK